MCMSLSSAQLDAFYEVARASSFSKAARNLFVTQSALSQRIKKLEDELGTSLLVRETSGVRLTAAGEELIRYCKNRQELESEYLERVNRPKSNSITGIIRVGGYSTVTRSVILTSLSHLLVNHHDVRAEVTTKEMRELPRLLRNGEVDFVLLDHAIEKEGIESIVLGFEENVLIESAEVRSGPDVFLDHDIEDDTTFRFFELQGSKPKKLSRVFLDDIYGILDGVALGFGRAVVPRHLLHSEARVRVVPGFKSLRVPVYLNFYRQPVHTRLHATVVEHLSMGAKKRLTNKVTNKV